MRKVAGYLAMIALVLIGQLGLFTKAHAAFNPNLLIDDSVFSDTASMSAAQIDSWLNINFPSSCISPNNGFAAPDPTGYSPSAGFTFGGPVSAGSVIYDAAQAYGLNPQVLLTTLQKEEGLVRGDGPYGCSALAMSASVGYGCPDSGSSYSYSNLSPPLYYSHGTAITSVSNTCVNTSAKAGFSQQLIRAAWLLKFGEQRSLGNTSWAVIKGGWDNSDDPPTCYGGPMTQGTLKRCQNSTPTFFDGYTTIDGTATHMDTGATAALYWYTPHFHGNQSFVSLFEGWFGSTISSQYYSCHNSTNIANVLSGRKVLRNNLGSKTDNLTLNFLNNTGSACIELHTWGPNQQAWIRNIATNHPAASSDDEVLSGDYNGDGKSEFYLIKYRNTGSGHIEIHGWDSTTQQWAVHIATNHPEVDPADDRVIMADTNGDGHDEFLLVKYRHSTSGHIEIHDWAPGFQGWTFNIATNHPEVDPTNDQVVPADLNGDHVDELNLVKLNDGASGRIEIHTWLPGYRSWYSNIATNHPAVNPTNNAVIAANNAGDGKDRMILVKYYGGQSGRVEIHTWNPGFQSWMSNIATNHPQIDW